MTEPALNEQEAIDEAEAILRRAKLRNEILESLVEMEPEVRKEMFWLAVKWRIKLIFDPIIKAWQQIWDVIQKAYKSFIEGVARFYRQCFGGLPTEYATAGYPCGKSLKGLHRWQRRQRTGRRKQWRRERGLVEWQR